MAANITYFIDFSTPSCMLEQYQKSASQTFSSFDLYYAFKEMLKKLVLA